MQLSIPITKAGNAKITVDTDELYKVNDGEMYALALAEGLKVILNKNMSKISVKDLEGDALEEARAAALAKGQENFDKLMKGEIKVRGSAAKGNKVPGPVMTEARRLAKEVIKNEIRAAGMKVSHVEASVITKAANQLIADDPSYIEQATTIIAERKAKTATAIENETERQATAKARLEKLGGVFESPKLKAKADAEKAARKSTLSKTQAGKVAPRRAKPGHETHAVH